MILSFKNFKPDISRNSFIFNSALVSGDVSVGDFSAIWFNAIVRGDRNKIKIGSNSHIQDNAVVHADPENEVEIGDNVIISHSAVLHGCRIKDNAMVGIGATILDGAEIGSYSIIGANAIVPPNTKIPEKSVAMGVPVRVVRETKEEDLKRMRELTEAYLELCKEYKKKGQVHSP